MKKILAIIKYVLLAICVVMLVIVMINGENGVTPILTWAAILLGIAVAVTLLFPLINVVTNPKGAMRTLIGLGVVAIILGIAYAMSDTTPVVNSGGGFFEKAGELKLTDTGLYTTYFALGAAILVVIIGELRNSFK